MLRRSIIAITGRCRDSAFRLIHPTPLPAVELIGMAEAEAGTSAEDGILRTPHGPGWHRVWVCGRWRRDVAFYE